MTYDEDKIQKIANSIRKQILGIAINKGGCYLAQACSSAEIIACLYEEVLNITESIAGFKPIPFPGVPGPENMNYEKGNLYNGRIGPNLDRLFVSCCHYASVIYAGLSATGRLTPEWTTYFNVDGWNMEMIGAEHSPGFENTAGSLGQTISIAAGTAHARKIKGETGKVFTLLGDGELQEGQTWECVQTAAYYKLDNFIMVVDMNDQQVEGAIENQMDINSNMEKRFISFGAEAVTVNGHSIPDIISAFDTRHQNKPLVVICKTKGYTGVPILKKRWPFLHFVNIAKDEVADFEKIYHSL